MSCANEECPGRTSAVVVFGLTVAKFHNHCVQFPQFGVCLGKMNVFSEPCVMAVCEPLNNAHFFDNYGSFLVYSGTSE